MFKEKSTTIESKREAGVEIGPDKVIVAQMIKERINGPFINFSALRSKIKRTFRRYRNSKI